MDGSFMLDHNYEFDAPKHVDFGRLDEGEVANDSWFDRHSEKMFWYLWTYIFHFSSPLADDSEDIPLEPENQPGPDMSTVAQNLISNAIGSHSRPASVVPPVTETTEEARVPGEDAVDGIERGPSVEKSIVTENAEHMKETDNHEVFLILECRHSSYIANVLQSSAIGKSLEENSCPEVVKSQIPPEPSDSADGSSEAQTSVAEASKNDSIKKVQYYWRKANSSNLLFLIS